MAETEPLPVVGVSPTGRVATLPGRLAGSLAGILQPTSPNKKGSQTMSLTHSTMLELGTQAPDFELPDTAVQARRISLNTFTDTGAAAPGPGWRHVHLGTTAPTVKHLQRAVGAFAGSDYADSDIGIASDPSANDRGELSRRRARLQAQRRRPSNLAIASPYCHDETQQIAQAYTAACTPDFFLFGDGRKLVYRGQLDESRPDMRHPSHRARPARGDRRRRARRAIALNADQKPSIGCNIKWKPGNEPTY